MQFIVARVAPLLLLLACGAPDAVRPARVDAGFRGPGRLVLIFEPADPEQPRALVVHDAAGARELAIEQPRAARWLAARELLVSQEVAPEEPYGLPRIQLLRVDAESGAARPFAEPARWFDAEPDPRGERLAIGAEVDDQGESDLLVLALAAADAKPSAGRSQPLDRPRWRPDGAELVVLQTLPDPGSDEDSETGMSFGGQALSWPRLFRVGADLEGRLAPLYDADPGKGWEAGGTLPLWWGAGGIYARQRRGLVRCDPDGSGCTLVFAPGEKKRVVDGRAAGADHALVLVRDVSTEAELDLPAELHRVALATGASELLYRAPRDLFLAELDWVAAP